MDKITKALKKLTPKERELFRKLLEAIEAQKFSNLDIKKLSGHDDIYRVRKGQFRVIFQLTNNKNVVVLALERRSDQTYSKY